jgi:polar amino acid transport system substrate-binding protein
VGILLTNIWLGSLVVIIAAGVAVALVIKARDRAPHGGFFSDSDRAAGIFNCVGTMFSVLLALVIFLSVESYQATQSHAHAEADSVLEQFQTARLFPSRDQYAIQSQLICYGRGVAAQEWPKLNDSHAHPVVDGWALSIDSTMDSVAISGSKEDAAFQQFLAQTLERQQDRRGRLGGAEGALPPTVWPILVLGAITILAYMIAYADSGERVVTQAFQVGVVTLLLGGSLLLINALDHPFSENPGQIKPDKMMASLDAMESSLANSIDADNLDATLPCDAKGLPYDGPPGLAATDFPPSSSMREIIRRGKIVIGVNLTVPLFGNLDPVSGELSGFDIDLGRQIAKEMGLRPEQVEFKDITFADRIPALQRDEVDLVISLMTINAERRRQIDFSRPYYLSGQSILVQRGTVGVRSYRDFNGKRICSLPGTTSEQAVMDRAPDAQLVLRPTIEGCIAVMKAGEAEAASADDIVLAGFAIADDTLGLVGGQYTREPYGVGIKKGKEDLVRFVNDVINKMLADGRWGKLYYEYLGDISGLPTVREAKLKLPQIE